LPASAGQFGSIPGRRAGRSALDRCPCMQKGLKEPKGLAGDHEWPGFSACCCVCLWSMGSVRVTRWMIGSEMPRARGLAGLVLWAPGEWRPPPEYLMGDRGAAPPPIEQEQQEGARCIHRRNGIHSSAPPHDIDGRWRRSIVHPWCGSMPITCLLR
jgi:hypothetical protein